MNIGDEVWILEAMVKPRKGWVEEVLIPTIQLTPSCSTVRYKVRLWSFAKKCHYYRTIPAPQIFKSREDAYDYVEIQNVLAS